MSCNGCYDGCVEITSDNCVKYMGPDVAALGISTGDTLASVEAAIIQYLQSALDASGITWTIDAGHICTLIDGYLPPAPYTLIDIINATFDAICDLDTRVTAIEGALTALNANYDVDCLPGVVDSTDTHDVLQATITALCDLANAVTSLGLSLNNYVPISEVDSYIAAYINGVTPPSTKHYLKMVPYTAVEFYGDLAGKFDATGAGIIGTDWENIYLCNGENGTPDKRGRIPVGTTTMGNTPFNHNVDPGVTGNPTYDLLDTQGTNLVALAEANLPPHTHTATSVVSESPHSHSFASGESYLSDPPGGTTGAGADNPITVSTSAVKTNLTVATTNALTGGGEAHSNIPPVLACHYIMYIPA